MAKLLHFEFHKLIRQKSFYICLAVAVAMLVVSTCVAARARWQTARVPCQI